MKQFIRTLSNLPQFQITPKIYEKVFWMFVIPTYDVIISKDFFNRCSKVTGNSKLIWSHFKENSSEIDSIILKSDQFDADSAKVENNRLIRFLTKKYVEITAETCEIQERLSQIASELSPGELSSVHFNSFSSISESSEILTTNDYHDEN